MSAAVLEAAEAVLEGRLGAREGAEACRGVAGEQLADVLAVLWTGVEGEETQEAFVGLVEALVADKVLQETVMLQVWPESLLYEAGLIEDDNAMRKMQVRVKSNAVYAQKKFNLLREESEGYAKFVQVALQSTLGPSVDAAEIRYRLTTIIGSFNLDPNHCIDILLTVFATDPHNSMVEPLFTMFETSSIAHVLGFGLADTLSKQHAPCVIRLCAALIASGIVDMDHVYPHLCPADDVIVEARRSHIAAMRKRIEELTVVNLNEESSAEVARAIAADYTSHNHKFALFGYLYELRQTEQAQVLMTRFQYLRPASSCAVSKAVASVLDRAVKQPCSTMAYALLSEQQQLEAASPDTYLEELQEHLCVLDIYLCRDTALLSSILRSLVSIQQQSSTYTAQVKRLLCTRLLPAFSLAPSSFALAQDLWQLMQTLTVSDRYEVYAVWKEDVYTTAPELELLHRVTIKTTKFFQKRIAAKRELELSRLLLKFVHANPIPVLELLLDQIQVFDNLVSLAVDLFQYLSPLCHDIALYLVTTALVDPIKSKLKSDGTSIATWFQCLSSFTAQLFHRYPDTLANNASILDLIVHQMYAERSLNIVLLHDMMTQMTGIAIKDNMTEDQVLGQAGGRELRSLMMDAGASKRSYTKASPVLKTALLQEGRLEKLAVLLLQQKEHVVYKEEELRDTKLLGNLVDRLHDIALQLSELCSVLLSDQDQQTAFSSIRDRLDTFHLTTPDAMLLARITGADTVDALLPSSDTDVVPHEVLSFIWSHRLSDVFFPEKQYAALAASTNVPAAVLTRLTQEQEQHKAHVESMRTAFTARSDWFSEQGATAALFRRCFLPLALISEQDSFYVYCIVQMLHESNTAHFSTVDTVFAAVDAVQALLYSMTYREARRFALLLVELLRMAAGWHESPKACKSHLLDRPGSVSERVTLATLKDVESCREQWHASLMEAFQEALASESSIGCRNALLLLNRIQSLFPSSKEGAVSLHTACSTLLGQCQKGSDIHSLVLHAEGALQNRVKALQDMQLRVSAPDFTPTEANLDDVRALRPPVPSPQRSTRQEPRQQQPRQQRSYRRPSAGEDRPRRRELDTRRSREEPRELRGRSGLRDRGEKRRREFPEEAEPESKRTRSTHESRPRRNMDSRERRPSRQGPMRSRERERERPRRMLQRRRRS